MRSYLRHQLLSPVRDTVMKKKSPKRKEDILNQKDIVTISELAYFMGAQRRILERLVILEVIEPVSSEPEFSFSVEILPHLKKIMRLHHELGVSWSSMGLVLDLLDHIEELESKLEGR